MKRREFLAAGAATIADFGLRIADWQHSPSGPPNPQSTIRNPQSAQEPTLAPEVFARRIERAQAELKNRKLDFLIATPGTNYEYFTGYNPGRSERLIAVVVPGSGSSSTAPLRTRGVGRSRRTRTSWSRTWCGS